MNLNKKYLDVFLCSLTVGLLWFCYALYLKFTILQNKEPIVGFGYLIMLSYIILIIFFSMKGLLLGTVSFCGTITIFFFLCLLLAIYKKTQLSFVDFIIAQLKLPYCPITFFSGSSAGLVTTFFKKKRLSVFIGVGLFVVLTIGNFLLEK